MIGDEFILGVNYWPQRKAMFMWREFDRAAIEDDLATISGMGISSVRTFLLWEDFQPLPKSVSTIMLDRLVDFLEIADARNPTVLPSLFTGYMSGLIWLPPWMLQATVSEHQPPVFSMDKVRRNMPKNPYIDVEIIEAQIFCLREVTNALAGHPALLGWDLGNEPSRWAVPPDETSANLWLQAMVETLKERDDAIPITLGLNGLDLENRAGLTAKLAGEHLDYLSIQVWTQNVAWSTGPLDLAVVPFFGVVAEWLGSKPVMVQEFGVPTIPILSDSASRQFRAAKESFLVSEDDLAAQVAEAIANIGRFNIGGVFWKSYGDYHPTIWKWPPLAKNVGERFCGLLRHDGSPKPVAAAFVAANTGPSKEELTRDWLDMPEEDFYKDPRSSLARLYHRFREHYSFG
jgi:endo-1,4-beta-mannosidase